MSAQQAHEVYRTIRDVYGLEDARIVPVDYNGPHPLQWYVSVVLQSHRCAVLVPSDWDTLVRQFKMHPLFEVLEIIEVAR